MRSYVLAGILVLAASACTGSLTGPTESVTGTAALMPQCIHVTTGGGVDFGCDRGEPEQGGAPPAVIVDGVDVNGG